MTRIRYSIALLLMACAPVAAEVRPADRLPAAAVLEQATDSDWRTPDPHYTLYLSLPSGIVVMELAPAFAPEVIENLRVLTESGFFSKAAIVRSQENYVVQWGDPASGTPDALSLGDARRSVKPEFFRAAAGLDFVALDSRDAYADTVGFVDGFPAATDGDRAWLAHCNGMLGVGRDTAPDSGNGAELYVVIGHAPRHLDRNVALIGRVLLGMELLSTLPRGTAELGFYATAAERVPIRWMRFADRIPPGERVALEVLRTDTPLFERFVDARRYRIEDWFVDAGGRISVCNVPLPVRVAGNKGANR